MCEVHSLSISSKLNTTEIDDCGCECIQNCKLFGGDLKLNKLKYFLKDEVVVHKCVHNFWIIIYGKILDLTSFLETRTSSMTKSLELLLQYGGKDLSHFFDKETGKPIMRMTASGNMVPIFPPVLEKSDSDYFGNRHLYWWNDPMYVIGQITSQPRKIRIINTLLATTQKMVVCEEDTIKDIQMKYRVYNWNYENYHWRKYDAERDVYLGLCIERTLSENGLLLQEYKDPHTPSLWLFFKEEENQCFG